jgi:hypothetical protein
MKIAVRFKDGSKNLLDDHVDDDNSTNITDMAYRKEFAEYIENMLRKPVATMLFEVVTVAKPVLA